jgi:hypothetical protein
MTGPKTGGRSLPKKVPAIVAERPICVPVPAVLYILAVHREYRRKVPGVDGDRCLIIFISIQEWIILSTSYGDAL